MRPQRLEIEGVHSFRTRQVVDFAALSAGGLFGIFGDTGSGKSTVLDCIILALYGETPGRETVPQFIHLSARTAFVALDFSIGAKRYRVERNFRLNPTRTTNTATAQLVDLDTGAVLCEQSRRVTAEIEQLLGLGIEDFCKVVALPQGEFSKFLKSASGEQTRIAGRLFSLERYGDELTAAANKRSAALKAEAEAAERAFAAVAEATPEKLEAETARLSELGRLSAEARKREAQAAAELEGLRKDAETTARLSEAERTLAELEKRLCDTRAESELAARKVACEAIYPAYESLVSLRARTEESRAAAARAEEACKAAEREAVRTETAEKEAAEALADVEKRTAEILRKLEAAGLREKEFRETTQGLEAARERFRALQKESEKAQAEIAARQAERAALGEKIGAGEARQRALAQAIAGVVNEAFLSALRSNFERDLGEAEKAFPGSETCFSGTQAVIYGARTDDSLSKEYAELSESLRDLREKKSACDLSLAGAESARNTARQKTEELEAEGGRLRARRDELLAALKETGAARFEEIPSLRQSAERERQFGAERLEKARAAFRTASETLSARRAAEASAKSDFCNLSERLEAERTNFEARLSAFGSERELVEIHGRELSAEEILARTRALEERKKETEIRKNALSESLKNPVSPEELEAGERAYVGIRERAEQCRREEIVCGEALERLKKDAEARKEAEKTLREAKKRADRVEAICSAIRGKALMKFAVEEYLREICVSASAILGGITGGGYRLVYENRESRECGFFVVDNRNGGEKRAVATLSGGETFLVSLSLAVSLSEAVASGRNRVEFFFLDEGFGSLDAKLCDVVLDALDKLKEDRFVIGLISHVESLKERLSSRLLVTFDEETGSRVRI